MNKFKTILLSSLLIIPFYMEARKIDVNPKIENGHRSPSIYIPIDAFINETNHELTLIFHENIEHVSIEIKDYKETIVYQNDLTYAKVDEEYSFPLHDISSGKVYILTIKDNKQTLNGHFVL